MSETQAKSRNGVSLRTCAWCGVPIGRKSTTGRCLSCAVSRWRPEEMLGAIRRFYVQWGRVPTAKEWSNASPDRPSANHLKHRFGSFNAAIRAAGFTPRKPGQHGGHLRDHRKPKPLVENGFTPDEELAFHIAEQERDYRFRHSAFAYTPDAMSSRFKTQQGVYTDDWTLAVCHLVDRRREIDAWGDEAAA